MYVPSTPASAHDPQSRTQVPPPVPTRQSQRTAATPSSSALLPRASASRHVHIIHTHPTTTTPTPQEPSESGQDTKSAHNTSSTVAHQHPPSTTEQAQHTAHTEPPPAREHLSRTARNRATRPAEGGDEPAVKYQAKRKPTSPWSADLRTPEEMRAMEARMQVCMWMYLHCCIRVDQVAIAGN